MIKLHHLERSRSHRVLWLLEELGVPYEIVEYKRNPETLLAPPSLTKVHPLGKSPVITDGDNTVAESGAIIEYLAERHGGANLVPAVGSVEHQRSDADQAFICAKGMMSGSSQMTGNRLIT